MIDAEIRRLERAVDADPSDAVALEALAAARTRAGRGWADEPLPLDLRCSPKERGVYVWTRHGLGLEFVRVPASAPRRVDFDPLERARRARRHESLEPMTSPAGPAGPAFWVGRYPVTWGEWLLSDRRVVGRIPAGITPDHAAHPAVNVTHADAVAFCDWAGLRLPTAAEWTRAALGDETVPCRCDGPGVQPHRFAFGLACPRCRGTGAARPLYPWGNEPPTPERCVAASWVGRRTISGRLLASSGHEIQRTTRPVRDAEGRPARPLGASPCGAQDMVGHVWQWVAPTLAERLGEVGGAALGGSFRHGAPSPTEVVRAVASFRGDDVGFRVVLSAPEAAP